MSGWTSNTGQTKRVPYRCPQPTAPAAVDAAKRAARDEGWHVVAVVRVEYAPLDGAPAWTVTLELVEDGA